MSADGNPAPIRGRALGPAAVRRLGCVMMAIGALLVGVLPGLLYFVAVFGFGVGGAGPAQSYTGTTTDTVAIATVLALVVAIGATAMLAGYAYYRTGVARSRYGRPMLLCVALLALAAAFARLLLN
jgi:hypothetical protein